MSARPAAGAGKAGSRVAPHYRRLLHAPEEDPLGSVANLFDVAMVFAVALVLALFASLSIPELLTAHDDLTIVRNAGKPDMEIITKKGVRIDRFRATSEQLGGNGRRLGVAYQLAGGEVVYVPDAHDEGGMAAGHAPAPAAGDGSREPAAVIPP